MSIMKDVLKEELERLLDLEKSFKNKKQDLVKQLKDIKQKIKNTKKSIRCFKD